MGKDKEWKLQPVCKRCVYRRPIDSFDNTKADTYWQHTACHYIIDTSKPRDGKPNGNYCPNFKPKEGSVKKNE